MPVGTFRLDSEPVTQGPAGFLPQRQDAFAPALADDVHLVEGRHLQIVERKPDQFRDPQAGVVGETQHRAVPCSRHGARIRRVEQSPRFRPVERADERHVALLRRDFTHLRGEVEISRVAELEEAEEGLDGREPGIACTHPVSAIPFEMFEELEKGRYVEMTDLERAGPDAVFVRREDDQRDEAAFSEPDRLDIARKGPKHAAFGHGVHQCIGAELARMETSAVIASAAARFERITLAGREPRYRRSTVVRGLERLEVRIERRHRGA